MAYHLPATASRSSGCSAAASGQRPDRLPAQLPRLPAVRGLRAGLARNRAGRGLDQQLARQPRGLRAPGLGRGCHVFVEKPIATTVADAEAVVARAPATRRTGARLHPARAPGLGELVEIGSGLGKPLVMRMNLNQQSSGRPGLCTGDLMASADADRRLRRALCRRDVPADGARPVRVHGIGAELRLSEVQNYGHLHVVFDDGWSAGTRPAGTDDVGGCVFREGRRGGPRAASRS